LEEDHIAQEISKGRFYWQREMQEHLHHSRDQQLRFGKGPDENVGPSASAVQIRSNGATRRTSYWIMRLLQRCFKYD
jgi:hypothetical protein